MREGRGSPAWLLAVIAELSQAGLRPASGSGWRVGGGRLEACLAMKGREGSGGLRRRWG